MLWDYALPCWVEPMAAVIELDREKAFDGKTLIRDRTESLPLGYRETRVELRFAKVAAGPSTRKCS